MEAPAGNAAAMTDELILSASSVAAYQACHWRWLLQYVTMQQGVSSMQSAVGTAVHAGAQAYYETQLDTERQVKDPVAEALSAADLTYLLEISNVADSDEDLLKYRPVVGRITTVYIEEVGSKIVDDVLGAEVSALARIDGILYSGHIDVLQHGPVRDTKVLGQKPRFPDDYRRAMTGYDLLKEALTGDRATDRILDILIRLKRDRPRYEPISFGVSTRRELRDFIADLNEAANGIASGNFEPTGVENGECRYCPVRYVCDYYTEGGPRGTTKASDKLYVNP